MTTALASEPRAAAEADAPVGPLRRAKSAFDRFWLEGVLMWSLEHWPAGARLTRPFFLAGAWAVSPALRRMTRRNAEVILGPDASEAARRRLARAFVAGAYDFLVDFGRRRRATLADLRREIERVEGIEHYERAREPRRGLIVLTAHLGAFEVGMAALRDLEPRIHVVFRRDRMPAFERLRAARRAALGVLEAPIDEGPSAWLRVRDALLADEVVLLQGDRVMPGQRSVSVPFCGSLVPFPTSPVRLAKLTGSPILPVFSVHADSGKVRVVVEEPMFLEAGPASDEEVHAAAARLARVTASHVRRHPEQYHGVHDAWREPSERGAVTG